MASKKSPKSKSSHDIEEEESNDVVLKKRKGNFFDIQYNVYIPYLYRYINSDANSIFIPQSIISKNKQS